MQSGYLVIVETKPPELYEEVREVHSEISMEEDNRQVEKTQKRISKPSVLIEFEH